MAAAGIICEYNPFHRGHQYHIARTREALGRDTPIVCAMSGNWVQRGSCAILDKWTRASLALRGGADLVLELPTVWAVSSAESFAKGGVEVLAATGVVDTLSFGSECADAQTLQAVARCLDSEAYRAALSQCLRAGVSFPAARQEAARTCIGNAAGTLSGPNDNLAVEYLRAMGNMMRPLPVLRVGAGHDAPSPADAYASASYIRERMYRHESVTGWLGYPLPSVPLADMARLEVPILAQLKRMEEEDWYPLPDSGVAEGLPARLADAASQAATLADFFAIAKTKRYTHARLRRLALWAFLGLAAADRPPRVPYLRVLGFNHRGQALLRQMKETAALPILTKPAHANFLDPAGQRLFQLEARCTSLYALAFGSPLPGGLEWTQDPVMS